MPCWVWRYLVVWPYGCRLAYGVIWSCCLVAGLSFGQRLVVLVVVYGIVVGVGLRSGQWGWEAREKKRTWASHLLGPLLVQLLPLYWWAHIPRKRGGAPDVLEFREGAFRQWWQWWWWEENQCGQNGVAVRVWSICSSSVGNRLCSGNPQHNLSTNNIVWAPRTHRVVERKARATDIWSRRSVGCVWSLLHDQTMGTALWPSKSAVAVGSDFLLFHLHRHTPLCSWLRNKNKWVQVLITCYITNHWRVSLGKIFIFVCSSTFKYASAALSMTAALPLPSNEGCGHGLSRSKFFLQGLEW